MIHDGELELNGLLLSMKNIYASDS